MICGHADPMHDASDLQIDDGPFSEIDRVELAATPGKARPCD